MHIIRIPTPPDYSMGYHVQPGARSTAHTHACGCRHQTLKHNKLIGFGRHKHDGVEHV